MPEEVDAHVHHSSSRLPLIAAYWQRPRVAEQLDALVRQLGASRFAAGMYEFHNRYVPDHLGNGLVALYI